jgi:hypothetical protein
MSLEDTYYLACPYCLEHLGFLVDLTAGSQEYVQDCEVCCQPILLKIKIEDGKISNIDADRENA